MPEDQGCLRWVLGVPLGLVYLAAAYCCRIALLMRPDGPHDDHTRADIEACAVAALCVSLLGLLLSLLPVYRRTLSRWWYLVPLALGLVAYVRALTA
ncbi:hypothetical protein E6R62_29565 [Streptomyces sp. A1136]|nr:hypothetical protein E6R62_29565 [Streptomyces sp. A1136]